METFSRKITASVLHLNVCRLEHDYVAERSRIQTFLNLLMSELAEMEEQESSWLCSESVKTKYYHPQITSLRIYPQNSATDYESVFRERQVSFKQFFCIVLCFNKCELSGCARPVCATSEPAKVDDAKLDVGSIGFAHGAQTTSAGYFGHGPWKFARIITDRTVNFRFRINAFGRCKVFVFGWQGSRGAAVRMVICAMFHFNILQDHRWKDRGKKHIVYQIRWTVSLCIMSLSRACKCEFHLFRYIIWIDCAHLHMVQHCSDFPNRKLAIREPARSFLIKILQQDGLAMKH